jgi:hypothetical protein
MGERRVPWWLFGIISAGALLASGIYVGVMSVEGASGIRLSEATAFGLLGLTMFWGAIHQGRDSSSS